MNKNAAKSGRSSKPAGSASQSAAAPSGQTGGGSVLSQSQGMTSSSAQAMGALAAKSSSGRAASNPPSNDKGASTAPASKGAASVLSQSAGMTSSSAQALAGLAAKKSSGGSPSKGAEAQSSTAAPTAARSAGPTSPTSKPDMTKSVLSMSTGGTSSAAQALGALAAKNPSGRKQPSADSQSGTAAQEAVPPKSDNQSPTRSGAATPVPAQPTPKGPDMTKSVLSMSTGGTSSAAQALGALASSKGGGRGGRPDMTKSVLSQSAAPTSSAAMALGGLGAKRSNDPSGYPEGLPVSPQAADSGASSPARVNPATGLASSCSSDDGMDSPGYPNIKVPNAVDLVSKPLLHPDDEKPSLYVAGGSRLPPKSFPWCAANGDMEEVRRPKQIRAQLAHPDSSTWAEQHLGKNCYAAQISCVACTHDVAQDIFGEI